MNVGRGLFRAWIFLTVLWIIGAGALGYFIIWDEVSSWKWRYLTVLRQGVEWGDLMNRPYYENTRSPSAEKLAVTFHEIEYQDVWEQSVRDRKATVIKMPDHSSLYLDTDLTEQDQLYLSKAFWDQRWWRYASVAKVWVPIFAVPPIVLFILGWAILWVGRGFKTIPS